MICTVAGAGGAIGGHLVGRLLADDHDVRAVDKKPLSEWYQRHDGANNRVADLSILSECMRACHGADEVYNLAADMGGMGFIETHKADCMLSVDVSSAMLKAARDEEAGRFFYSSSACAYAADKQTSPDVTALKESDAYPAMPEDVRLGEAVHGTNVPPFPGGLRTGDTNRPLPQRVRTARHVRRRPGEGASRLVSQGSWTPSPMRPSVANCSRC